ncbi:23S rRNA pseudouridine(2605) synthase RluB [Usitatibacter palustris]|uniref:Pseudouridine synthase n=1 Tax=Usitatibacter palustris TaxID=2732487 RepID=A0A6M4H580_9PROT|nr:pseudouridine synthase [Usitatibacter palustris]QJR14108.1 hypothetical protein DSM104440_00901 [Usitatibacter palustris]
MRDRSNSNQNLQWPGGIVPEWAKGSNNPNNRRRNKQRGKGGNRGGGGGGGGGQGGGKRERLQKVMAQSGHGSRRNIEILIAQGHITINGQVAKLGDLVGPGDKVKLDSHAITLRFGETLPQVLLYHKPEGEIVTRDDPQGRATVFEKLPRVQGGRWVSVGRLDLNTGGLLIFTTDGELANRLMHPRFEVEREYAVRLLGEMTDECREKLLAGIDIEGDLCKFESVEDRGGDGANKWYHVVIKEGRNREVRKMCEAVGLTVSRLLRVRYGPVHMPAFLKRGMMRPLEEQEVETLLAFAGMNNAAESEAGETQEDDEEDKFIPRAIEVEADLDPEDPPQPIDPRQAQPHQHHGNHQQQPRNPNQPPRNRGQGGQGGQGGGQGEAGNRQGKGGGKRGKHRNKPHGQGGQPGPQGQGRQGQPRGQQGQQNRPRHQAPQVQAPEIEPGNRAEPAPPPPVETPPTILRADPGQYIDNGFDSGSQKLRGDDRGNRSPQGGQGQGHGRGQGQGQQPGNPGQKKRGPRGKQRHRGARGGDEQPRYIPPKGDEQPRYVEPAKKENDRGDEQPLTNENRRVW